MRLHMIGLPHTEFDDVEFSSCAFTAKAVRTARMWRARGHEVIVYWGGAEADVSLLSVDEQEQHFGKWDPGVLPVIEWDVNKPYWQQFHQRAANALRERLQPQDLIALVGGAISQCIVNEFAEGWTVIEPGVGYEGIVPHSTFACFESYAWMHHRYGWYRINDGRAFDTVIPNAVVPEEWEVGASHGYALFVGRMIGRKGPNVAAEIAKAAGLRLLMAGAGVAYKEPGLIVCTDGTRVEGDHVTHVGSVSGEGRRRLFSHAEVFICPTLYIGPWEGVHAEAMMSGVPVVAPDYGVFTETVPERYRYHSLAEAVRAVELAQISRGGLLDSHWSFPWRQHAIDLCGFDVCADRYDAWLERLASLRDGRNGWYG